MTCGCTSSITVSRSRAASSTLACQKQPGKSFAGVSIIPESRHLPGQPRNRWSDTPSTLHAASSSPIRYCPSPPSASQARCPSSAGITSPSSPSVHVTKATCAPSAAYLAIVAPVPIDSSSGWACTRSKRLPSAAVIGASLPSEPQTAAGRIYSVTDSFPRQAARTMGFTLGVPRSFRLSPNGESVIFLRSRGGADPVTCLWVLDTEIGEESAEDDAVEKARRERARERAGGIVAFATDAACSVAAFALGGVVYVADLGPTGGVRELATSTPAADPRPDPTGTYVAYVSDGALRVHEVAT